MLSRLLLLPTEVLSVNEYLSQMNISGSWFKGLGQTWYSYVLHRHCIPTWRFQWAARISTIVAVPLERLVLMFEEHCIRIQRYCHFQADTVFSTIDTKYDAKQKGTNTAAESFLKQLNLGYQKLRGQFQLYDNTTGPLMLTIAVSGTLGTIQAGNVMVTTRHKSSPWSKFSPAFPLIHHLLFLCVLEVGH